MPAEPSSHRVIHPSVLYVGTPAYLVGTVNPDGTTNLAPASSHFSLGKMIVLGLENGGQSLDNVRRHGEVTVNFPSADQWAHVERLAGVTGKHPVPAEKASSYTFEPDKFGRAGLTPIASEIVAPDRVAEAPLQCECRVARITDSVDGAFGIVEAEVVRVHALREIAIDDTDYVDPHAWHPLIYSFRHFFDRGDEVGWTRKSKVAHMPERIERWEAFGGTWDVRSVEQGRALIDLCRCDGGEVVETIDSGDPGIVRWAAVQQASRA